MRNPNQPAFHVECPIDGHGNPASSTGTLYGLTKREYFAAMALQAIVLKTPHKRVFVRSGEEVTENELAAAAGAVAYADALIEELSKPNG